MDDVIEKEFRNTKTVHELGMMVAQKSYRENQKIDGIFYTSNIAEQMPSSPGMFNSMIKLEQQRYSCSNATLEMEEGTPNKIMKMDGVNKPKVVCYKLMPHTKVLKS